MGLLIIINKKRILLLIKIKRAEILSKEGILIKDLQKKVRIIRDGNTAKHIT